MRSPYFCGSAEHTLSRRQFLGGAAAGVGGALGFGSFIQPLAAHKLDSAQKRVLVIFLLGGSSQLETWDPKPGTNTGGPFQTIATSVPGVHICELLPFTATQMHRMALVRGINTANDDHGGGDYIMNTGRRREPAMTYPHLGSVCAKPPAPPTIPCPATSTSRRAATAASARKMPPSSARAMPLSRSATARRPPTSNAPPTCPRSRTASARSCASRPTNASCAPAAPPRPRPTPIPTTRPPCS